MSPCPVPHTDLLRHTLSTLAYRAAKVLRDVPASFAGYRPSEQSRSAVEILAHIGDLLDWAVQVCDGRHVWHEAKPLPWAEEVERFFRAAQELDGRLSRELQCSPGQLFQGPIADALTHTGQLAMMRRMAGYPVRGENYLVANIRAGQIGAEQAPAVREFD